MEAHVETKKRQISVILSERNLRALLSKVHDPDSARTITTYNVYEDWTWPKDLLLVVSVESDAQHYAGRTDGPGPMSNKTENAIRQSQSSLKDQLEELHKLATCNGLYDAADYLKRNLEV